MASARKSTSPDPSGLKRLERGTSIFDLPIILDRSGEGFYPSPTPPRDPTSRTVGRSRQPRDQDASKTASKTLPRWIQNSMYFGMPRVSDFAPIWVRFGGLSWPIFEPFSTPVSATSSTWFLTRFSTFCRAMLQVKLGAKNKQKP